MENSEGIKADEHEFEETRRCLLNSYHSYIQTHAGYLIVLTIGGFALITEWKNFAGIEIVFVLLLIVTIFAFGFMILRIIYWTMYANYAIALSMDEAVNYFTQYASRVGYRFAGKAPYMVMLQLTITHTIYEVKKGKIEKEKLDVLHKLALWMAGGEDPDKENKPK